MPRTTPHPLPEPTSPLAQTPPPADGAAEPCPSCWQGSQFIGGAIEAQVRCRDCFGSGLAGGGMVETFATRALASTVACPRCGSFAGAPCIGSTGQVRTARHAERHRAAVARAHADGRLQELEDAWLAAHGDATGASNSRSD